MSTPSGRIALFGAVCSTPGPTGIDPVEVALCHGFVGDEHGRPSASGYLWMNAAMLPGVGVSGYCDLVVRDDVARLLRSTGSPRLERVSSIRWFRFEWPLGRWDPGDGNTEVILEGIAQKYECAAPAREYYRHVPKRYDELRSQYGDWIEVSDSLPHADLVVPGPIHCSMAALAEHGIYRDWLFVTSRKMWDAIAPYVQPPLFRWELL